MVNPYEAVLEALEAAGLSGTPTHRGGWMYQCPAHEDNQASLSVSEGDDEQALLYCFAGCPTAEVVDALGLEWSDLFRTRDRIPVDQYVYRLGNGMPHIRVVRYEPKGFTQDHYDTDKHEWISGLNGVLRVPFNLEHLTQAKQAGWPEPVYLTEGEKDAETLEALGVLTSTLLGGAGKWRDEYAQYFLGADVVIVADADDVGRTGAETIARHLDGVANTVRIVVPCSGKDATNHVQAGYGIDDFIEEGTDFDEFGPLDWETYEVEQTEWLLEPYVPRGGRVLAFGPAGSLKSLWSMWLAAHVAQDGGRVAYFSLEMLPSDTARRLKQLNPPKDRFLCFTKGFRIGSPSHLEKMIRGLKEYDLIVIDSWTAARAGMKDSNEQIAQLDTEFFLPLVRHTGAAVIMIDNTGHPVFGDKGKIKMDHARGASAKGDKADVTVWFDRPYEDNNYLTTLTVKKMRLDYAMPHPVNVVTPSDRIEFFYADDNGTPHRPMWQALDVADKADLSPYEDVAVARLRDRFKAL